MKTISVSESAILIRAKRIGYLIQECVAFEGCYFIVDMNTNLVIAGAQEFMAWEEVVQWVLEADIPPTLN
jgi:hypothetical protein